MQDKKVRVLKLNKFNYKCELDKLFSCKSDYDYILIHTPNKIYQCELKDIKNV
jgi:hypothetical protein